MVERPAMALARSPGGFFAAELNLRRLILASGSGPPRPPPLPPPPPPPPPGPAKARRRLGIDSSGLDGRVGERGRTVGWCWLFNAVV